MDCCSTSISLLPKAWKQRAAQLKMATLTDVGLDKQLESLPMPHSTTASHHKGLAQALVLFFLSRIHDTLALDLLEFSAVRHPL